MLCGSTICHAMETKHQIGGNIYGSVNQNTLYDIWFITCGFHIACNFQGSLILPKLNVLLIEI